MKDSLPGILLVDDDTVVHDEVFRLLKQFNVINPLHFANDGVEALELLTGYNDKERLEPAPKIVLLDLNMPRMNGLEFLAEIRKLPEFNTLNIFILTTSESENDVTDAHELDISGYFLKPFMAEDFFHIARKCRMCWAMQDF